MELPLQNLFLNSVNYLYEIRNNKDMTNITSDVVTGFSAYRPVDNAPATWFRISYFLIS
jgi:hypothetical protein